MIGENGPAALSTVWERERRRGQGKERVLIPLHRMEEETAVVKTSTRGSAVVVDSLAFLMGVVVYSSNYARDFL